jgi:hypothetical protein
VVHYGKGGKAHPCTYALADTPPLKDSGSLVPGIVWGTTKPESQNGLIVSNDAAVCGSQNFPNVPHSWEPENGLGNQNPASGIRADSTAPQEASLTPEVVF